jgi:hypothetical protein
MRATLGAAIDARAVADARAVVLGALTERLCAVRVTAFFLGEVRCALAAGRRAAVRGATFFFFIDFPLCPQEL